MATEGAPTQYTDSTHTSTEKWAPTITFRIPLPLPPVGYHTGTGPEFKRFHFIPPYSPAAGVFTHRSLEFKPQRDHHSCHLYWGICSYTKYSLAFELSLLWSRCAILRICEWKGTHMPVW